MAQWRLMGFAFDGISHGLWQLDRSVSRIALWFKDTLMRLVCAYTGKVLSMVYLADLI
jgi:hypothetical protein